MKPVARPIAKPVARSFSWNTGLTNLLYENYPFAVGYSLSKIRQVDYKCLTVRRSSDSLELDIGFKDGLLDTETLLDFCDTDSGYVRRWYDPSPNANHAEQTINLLQPKIVDAGSLVVNEFGKPAIQFIKASISFLGTHLVLSPWHTASQSYIGTFSAYSLESAGNYPFILGSTPIDRGLSIQHNLATRNARTYVTRSTVPFGTGTSPLTLSQTYIRHDSANRTRLKTCFDTSTTALIDVADANTNFNMPSYYWFGTTNLIGTVLNNTKSSAFIAYISDQTENELEIRTQLFNYWRAN